MTPQILSCDENLEMECPSGVVFAIKANQQDFMLFGRHGSREIGIEKEQQIERETEEKKN